MATLLDTLTSIQVGKRIEGTYKGIAFKGTILEAGRYDGNNRKPPICFTVRLDGESTGLTMEEDHALFYSSDTWQANGAILKIERVTDPRKRR